MAKRESHFQNVSTGPAVLGVRAQMALEVPALAPRPSLQPGYEFVSWGSRPLVEVAAVEFASFRGGVDAALHPEALGSKAKCLRAIGTAIHAEDFAPPLSMLVLHRDQLVGHLVASRSVELIAAPGEPVHCTLRETCDVTHVAALTEHRGGLGRAMMTECISRCAALGIHQIELCVTLENSRAAHLYRSLGFREQHRLLRSGQLGVTTSP